MRTGHGVERSTDEARLAELRMLSPYARRILLAEQTMLAIRARKAATVARPAVPPVVRRAHHPQ